MEVPGIITNREVSRYDAYEAFLEYKDQVDQQVKESKRYKKASKSRRETMLAYEDRELMKAYKALSTGNRVINIVVAMRETGVDHHNRPKLAIARADARFCTIRRSWTKSTDGAPSRTCYFFVDEQDWSHSIAHKNKNVRVPVSIWPGEMWFKNNWHSLRAVVPTIPPTFRPKDLTKYHILWDAVWLSTAPRDPILLKRVSDNFFVVVAQWDLTEVERAVLGGRF